MPNCTMFWKNCKRSFLYCTKPAISKNLENCICCTLWKKGIDNNVFRFHPLYYFNQQDISWKCSILLLLENKITTTVVPQRTTTQGAGVTATTPKGRFLTCLNA